MSELTNAKKYVNIAGLTKFWENAKIYINASKASDVVYSDVEEGETTKKYIYLVDKDGNKLGNGFDASEFIKDGMLKSVDLKDTKLYFTWNTDSGYSTTEVELNSFVDLYTGDGESIVVDDSNKISVKSVSANKTVLNNDIIVADGPIADDTADNWPVDWKDSAGNRIIPKDKSLEDILEGLFLKEKDGTVKWGDAVWNPSLDKPTVTLSNTGTVEVGTTVTVNTITYGEVVPGDRTATCVCTEGYFDENDNTWHGGNKIISIPGRPSGEPTLSFEWNDSTITGGIKPGSTLQVVENTNTLEVFQTGESATCDALPTTTVYASSNTKKKLDEVKATFEDTKPDDVPLTSSNSATCTGKYKYFLGYSTNVKFNQFDSAAVRNLLVKSGWINVNSTTTIVGDTAIKSDGTSIVIACPAKYKLASITNGVGANIIDNFTTAGSYGSVDVATGNITTTYTVYVYPITNGADVEFKNVTLTLNN